MRPAGRGELDSLYFSYPDFEFRRPPEMDGSAGHHPVIVVGAGPVGMTAALELARRNVPCVVLDAKRTLNDGSRAICISRSSFETLQQLGVVSAFEHKGLGWTHGRCYYRERMIYRLEMPHSGHERYLPMYNLQQQYIEQFLVDAIDRQPELIDIRWQSEAIGIREYDGGIEVIVRTPDGQYVLRGDYLLAADGARSMIRSLLGLRLDGENLPGNYVIADVQMKHDFPTERRSYFESSANPDSTILEHRQPDDIWRIDWQLPEGQDPDEAIREDNVRARLQAILDMIGHDAPWELEWWSIYTANTLCLDEYRHGRTIFIGDAAHIVPIFGVRGLNNGFADAVNAAWKLAYVLHGEGGDGLLDTYTAERRGATLDVFLNAGKSSRFMTPPSRGFALMRKAALQLSLSQEFTRRFADPRQVLPYTYSDSPLTSYPRRDLAFTGGVPAGGIAINRKIAAGDFLLDHLGPGFTGLYFTTERKVTDAVVTLFSRLQGMDHRFKPVVIAPAAMQQTAGDLVVDPAGAIFAAYAAQNTSFYLLRPDRHVAARWLNICPEEVDDALSTALARNR